MKELQTIGFNENNVRVFYRNGSPWWALTDVCKILGLTNPAMVADRLDDDERYKQKHHERSKTPGGPQSLVTINEAGLYKVITRSSKLSKSRMYEIIKTFQDHGFLSNISLYSRKENDFFDLLSESLQAFNIEIQNQFYVDGYRIDGYIESLNIAIEYDENNHNHYDISFEVERQKYIEKKLGCRFIRVSDFNSDGFNVGFVIKNIIELTAV